MTRPRSVRRVHLAGASVLGTMLTLATPAIAADAAAIAAGAGGEAFGFVAAADIAASVLDGSRLVLDVRSIGEHLAGHVPGSVHLDDERLRGPARGLPGQLLTPADTARVLAAAGATPDRPVLIIGSEDDPLSATLTAWCLLHTGHPDVVVLDGGWPAWAGSHPVTRQFTVAADSAGGGGGGGGGANVASTAGNDPTGSSRGALPVAPRVALATLSDIREHIGWDTITFVDARPPQQYRGEVTAWPRGGHIPGAINLPWKRLTEPDNPSRLRSKAEIEAIVRDELGIETDADIVVSCGTGREATLLALALEHVLGHERVRLYAGSWSEYAAHPELPAEVGRRQPPRVRVHRDGEGADAISFSGQPDERTLRWLRDEGVTTLINCRSEWELANRMPYEDALPESLGFRVVSIPLGGSDGYEPKAVERLAEVIAASDGAVHLHCSSGGRARTLWTAWLVRHEGLDPDAAMQRAAAVGGGPSSLERLLGERLDLRRGGRPIEAGASD